MQGPSANILDGLLLVDLWWQFQLELVLNVIQLLI